MKARALRWRLGLAASALLVSGCLDFKGELERCVASGRCGSGADGGSDAGAEPDAGLDGGFDAGVDAGCAQELCFEREDSFSRSVYGIWGTSDDDVYVVGDRDGIAGFVQHWDGAQWSELSPGGAVPRLLGMGGTAGNLWICGDNVLRRRSADGGWQDTSPASTFLMRAVATAGNPDEAYAGGAGGVIQRWDGAHWTWEQGGGDDITGLWAGPSDAWAVDAYGVIHHRTDAGWAPQDAGTSTLYGVWGWAPTGDLWVAGEKPSGIEHLTDAGWRTEWTETAIAAIHGVSASDVWALGLSGEVLHRNASRWAYIDAGVHLPSFSLLVTSSSVWVVSDKSAQESRVRKLRRQGH